MIVLEGERWMGFGRGGQVTFGRWDTGSYMQFPEFVDDFLRGFFGCHSGGS
jgi:hypothetical protein